MGSRVLARAAPARDVFSSLCATVFLLTLSAVASAQSAPGGLYIGYYHEDPISNPEDPVPGALYLSLPAGDSSFAGKMFFTYLGCQTSSVGSISGAKTQ
jgi:hypothetical protein